MIVPPTETVTGISPSATRNGASATAARIRSARAVELLDLPDRGSEHAELLAAPPGDEIPAADALLEPADELAEHAVSRRVAVGVVDLLEPVGVDDQQPGRVLPSEHRLAGALELHLEEGAARGAGEPVAEQRLVTLGRGSPRAARRTGRRRRP